jgi:deoxyribodipyrimidine photolyase-related protein
MTECRIRNLVIVLGGQLDETSSAFDGFDPALDMVWMAEVSEESEPVWSAKQRIAVFLSAMHPLHTTFGRGLGL